MNASGLSPVGTGASCTGAPTVTIAYDTAGRRMSLTLPNGVQEAYNYDDGVLPNDNVDMWPGN